MYIYIIFTLWEDFWKENSPQATHYNHMSFPLAYHPHYHHHHHPSPGTLTTWKRFRSTYTPKTRIKTRLNLNFWDSFHVPLAVPRGCTQLLLLRCKKWLEFLAHSLSGGRWSSFPSPQWAVQLLHVEWLEHYIESHGQHGFLGLDGLDTQCTYVEKPKDVKQMHVWFCLCNLCNMH